MLGGGETTLNLGAFANGFPLGRGRVAPACGGLPSVFGAGGRRFPQKSPVAAGAHQRRAARRTEDKQGIPRF